MKDVMQIQQHYVDLKFGDFKHAITGAMLWKGQHAVVEGFDIGPVPRDVEVEPRAAKKPG